MIDKTVLSMWKMTRGKFTEKVEKLAESELSLKLDGMTIGELVYHTAEVEYIFASWFFDRETKTDMLENIKEDKAALLQFLQEANDHLIEAMTQLDAFKWNEKVASRMGETTPVESIARLIYHTGIHAGQITMIQKLATTE